MPCFFTLCYCFSPWCAFSLPSLIAGAAVRVTLGCVGASVLSLMDLSWSVTTEDWLLQRHFLALPCPHVYIFCMEKDRNWYLKVRCHEHTCSGFWSREIWFDWDQKVWEDNFIFSSFCKIVRAIAQLFWYGAQRPTGTRTYPVWWHSFWQGAAGGKSNYILCSIFPSVFISLPYKPSQGIIKRGSLSAQQVCWGQTYLNLQLYHNYHIKTAQWPALQVD